MARLGFSIVIRIVVVFIGEGDVLTTICEVLCADWIRFDDGV